MGSDADRVDGCLPPNEIGYLTATEASSAIEKDRIQLEDVKNRVVRQT